jgi:hypothetical protein
LILKEDMESENADLEVREQNMNDLNKTKK